MQRLRSTWLALMGGALLVTLSVSAAFGAGPSNSTDGPRGQTVASFVHEVVFGADEETDEDLVEEDTEEETDETPELDEEESDDAEELEDADDAEETADLEGDPEANLLTGTHGECVSAVAHTRPDFESGRDFGAAVSEAAHTCPRGAEALDEDLSEETPDEELADTDPEETADEEGAEDSDTDVDTAVTEKTKPAQASAKADNANAHADANRGAGQTKATARSGNGRGREGGRP